MSTDVAPAVLGWLGFVSYLAAACASTKRAMAVVGLLSSVCYMLHYVFLGALGAAWATSGSVTNNLLAGWASSGSAVAKSVQRCIGYAYCLILAQTIFRGHFWDALPLVGSVTTTVAMQQENMIHLRMLRIAAQLPWLPYALHVGPPSTLASGLLFIGINAVALYGTFADSLPEPSSKGSKSD